MELVQAALTDDEFREYPVLLPDFRISTIRYYSRNVYNSFMTVFSKTLRPVSFVLFNHVLNVTVYSMRKSQPMNGVWYF